jgi:hypothetical protein
MKEGVKDVMMQLPVERDLTAVSACTLKKMRYWKPEGNELVLAKVLYFTAIRVPV